MITRKFILSILLFEINQSLVKCLQQLADFAKALEVADDFLDEYLQDPNGFVQIGHLLILMVNTCKRENG